MNYEAFLKYQGRMDVDSSDEFVNHEKILHLKTVVVIVVFLLAVVVVLLVRCCCAVVVSVLRCKISTTFEHVVSLRYL